jgi:hypothetical protein
MDKAVDNVQRRKRRFLDLSLQHDRSAENNREIKNMTLEDVYPKLNLMDKFRKKLGEHRSDYLPQFRLFDHNNDGYVDKPEFMKFANTTLGFGIGPSSDIFETLGDGKPTLTFNDLARHTNPTIKTISVSQPSGEYSRKLASLCSAAAGRQQTERQRQEQAEKPHVLKPALSTRSSARPAYLTGDTFASVMARPGLSDHQGHHAAADRTSPAAGDQPSTRPTARPVLRPRQQTLWLAHGAAHEPPQGRAADPSRTLDDSRSKRTSALRNYELRVQLLDTAK